MNDAATFEENSNTERVLLSDAMVKAPMAELLRTRKPLQSSPLLPSRRIASAPDLQQTITLFSRVTSLGAPAGPAEAKRSPPSSQSENMLPRTTTPTTPSTRRHGAE